MATEDTVGTASVNIEAIISVNEESLSTANAKIAEGLNADVSTPEGRPAGRGRARTGTPAAATVDATVKTKVEKNLGHDIQSEIDKTDYQLTIDTGSIRKQIEDALRAPFDIIVNAEVHGAAAAQQNVGVAHGAVTATGGAGTQAPIPQEITQLLRENKGALATNINNLYRNINEAFAAAGKGRFGRQNVEGTGSEVQKLGEIMERFGSSFGDLAQLTKTNKLTGGSLSPKELAASLGLKPDNPAIQTVAQAGVPGLLGAPGGGDPARKIGVLMSRVSAYMATAPTAAPAAAQEHTIPVHEQRAADTTARVDAEKQRADAKQAVIAERQASLRITPLASPTVTTPPLERSQTVRSDPEADTRARQQLGGRERANVRRFRPRGTEIGFGTQKVDLENYLREAEMGRYQDVYEQFGGKGGRESMGLRRFEAQDVGGFDELSRLGRRKPGVKFGVAGQEGRFARVGPQEAMIRQIIKDLGIEEDAASQEQVRASLEPQMETIRKAVGAGAAPLRGTSGATKRGQGAPSIEGASDLGAQSKRLFEFIDMLDGKIKNYSTTLDRVNTDIERLAGSGQETGGLEDQAKDLSKEIQRFRTQRSEAQRQRETLNVEPNPANREATRLRAAESRRAVAGGVGLTPNEQLERTLRAPGAQGRYGAQLMEEMGATPEDISGTLLQRFRENTERPEGRGGMRALRQTAFGPRGRASRQPKESEGLYGELVAAIPADMGQESRTTLVTSIKDLLQSTIEEEQSRRDTAEAEIAKKEGATTRPLGRRRTVASAIATDEGISRVAMEVPVTGEGLYKSRVGEGGEVYVGGPGQTGQTRASVERSRKIAAGEIVPPTVRQGTPRPAGPFVGGPRGQSQTKKYSGEIALTEYPGEEFPDIGAELRGESEARTISMSAEDKKAAETRARTLGRGKYQSGAETEALAREAGVTMEEQPNVPPWAYLAAAAGAGGGAGGGAAGGAAGGGGGFAPIGGGGITGGAVPVFVTNWPAGGAGRGGGRGRVTAEGAEGQPEEVPAEARVKERQLRRKNIRTRDVGTAADTGRIYTFEPEETEDERKRAAASARFRELTTSAANQAGAAEGVGGGRAARGLVEAEATRLLQQQGRDPARARVLGVPSRERAVAEAQRSGVSLNLAEPGGVTGLLTSPPRPEVLQANAARQRAQRSLPQRAISTSFVQIAENLFGGLDAPQQRLATLANRTQDLSRLGDRATRLQEGRGAVIGEQRALIGGIRATEAAGGDAREQRARFAGLRTEFIGLTKESKNVAVAMATGAEEIEGLAKAAVTTTDVVRNLAAGAVGGVAGGLAAGGIAQATQAVIQISGQVLGPILERLSGFGQTTGRVQDDLAKQLRANNDRLTVTLAQTGITARLSDDQLAQISGPLGQRAQTVAGTQTLQQQFELFNSAQNIAGGRQNGADRALTRTTGGLFDVQLPFKAFGVQDISIGGQASTAEALTNQLATLTNQSQIQVNRAPNQPGRGQRSIGGENLLPDTRAVGDKQLEENNAQLKYLNQNLKSFTLISDEDKATLDKQALIFAQGGAQDLGGRLREKGIVARGVNAPEDVARFLAEFAKGPKLEPAQILAQDEPQIRAQIQFEDAQRQLQIQTINPQTTALAQAAQPLAPAATGVNTTGLTKEQAAGVNSELAQTQKLYDQINQETEAGVKAAKEFVATTFNYDPKVGQQFAASLDHVAEIGKQITSIEIGLQTKQAAYSAAQFSYQIDLAKRSLADARGLVSGIGDSLGAVERQMYNLQRESQSLSLGMTQRQINFQQAIAGFQSPGLTSEEREARKEQAKIEADYAQKQLDIQKQLFRLGGRQFTIQATRGVRDLVRQIGLLERGRVLSVETATAEKKIVALTKIQAKENKAVETYYNSAVQRTGDIMTEEAKLVAATQANMVEVGNLVLRAFKATYVGMTNVLLNGAQTNGGYHDQGGGIGGAAMGALYMGDDYHAAGWMGTVNGATSFGKYGVAGEAGGEAVAIVRSPRMLNATGAGGSSNVFTVIINNPIVKSDDDKRKLIADVKRAIQTEARLLLPGRA